jgi:hypothetical protein
VLEQVLGLGVDVELAVVRVLGKVESGDLRNVLILALTLLLLKFEGDTTDGSTLNSLHQVGGVAGNLYKAHQCQFIVISTVARILPSTTLEGRDIASVYWRAAGC